MTIQGKPKSLRPLKRVEHPLTDPPQPGAIQLEDPATGVRTWVTSVVQDQTDGITDADYDFPNG